MQQTENNYWSKHLFIPPGCSPAYLSLILPRRILPNYYSRYDSIIAHGQHPIYCSMRQAIFAHLQPFKLPVPKLGASLSKLVSCCLKQLSRKGIVLPVPCTPIALYMGILGTPLRSGRGYPCSIYRMGKTFSICPAIVRCRCSELSGGGGRAAGIDVFCPYIPFCVRAEGAGFGII